MRGNLKRYLGFFKLKYADRIRELIRIISVNFQEPWLHFPNITERNYLRNKTDYSSIDQKLYNYDFLILIKILNALNSVYLYIKNFNILKTYTTFLYLFHFVDYTYFICYLFSNVYYWFWSVLNKCIYQSFPIHTLPVYTKEIPSHELQTYLIFQYFNSVIYGSVAYLND